MFLYFAFLGAFLLLCTLSSVIRNRIFELIAIILVIFFSGTRFEVGYDYYNYYSFYEIFAPPTLEPLFLLSISLMKSIGFEYKYYFFLYSLSGVLIFYFAISRMTQHRKIAILIYLLIPGLFLNSFSIVRQGIACSITFLSLYYLSNNRSTLWFWLLSIAAMLLHYPAILFSGSVFIFKKLLERNYPFYIYLFTITCSLVLYKTNFSYTLLSLFGGKFEIYKDFQVSLSFLKVIVINAFFLYFAFFKNAYLRSSALCLFFNIYFLGVLIVNIFADFSPVTRLAYYFLIFQVIIVPEYIYSTYRESKNRNVVRFMLLFVFLLYYVLVFSNSLYSDLKLDAYPKMTPYQSWLLN